MKIPFSYYQVPHGQPLKFNDLHNWNGQWVPVTIGDEENHISEAPAVYIRENPAFGYRAYRFILTNIFSGRFFFSFIFSVCYIAFWYAALFSIFLLSHHYGFHTVEQVVYWLSRAEPTAVVFGIIFYFNFMYAEN